MSSAGLSNHCSSVVAGARAASSSQCTAGYRSLMSLHAWHTSGLPCTRCPYFRLQQPLQCTRSFNVSSLPQRNSRQNVTVRGSKRGRDSFFKDDFFQSGKDSFQDAKDLFAQGEKLFKKGDFQQGQRLFQQAEQQLRQARQQVPMQPFKSGNMDFRIPKIQIGQSNPSWKTSSLALLGIGAVATLVAGQCLESSLADKHLC